MQEQEDEYEEEEEESEEEEDLVDPKEVERELLTTKSKMT